MSAKSYSEYPVGWHPSMEVRSGEETVMARQRAERLRKAQNRHRTRGGQRFLRQFRVERVDGIPTLMKEDLTPLTSKAFRQLLHQYRRFVPTLPRAPIHYQKRSAQKNFQRRYRLKEMYKLFLKEVPRAWEEQAKRERQSGSQSSAHSSSEAEEPVAEEVKVVLQQLSAQA